MPACILSQVRQPQVGRVTSFSNPRENGYGEPETAETRSAVHYRVSAVLRVFGRYFVGLIPVFQDHPDSVDDARTGAGKPEMPVTTSSGCAVLP